MGLKNALQEAEGTAQEGVKPEGAIARCPLCRKDTLHAFRPFCSHKCKMVDLYRWVSGHYVIPGDPEQVLEKEKEEALEEWQEGGQDGPL
ncbi:MAG: DNA gyrase inhibitor YacG [Holosporaceae bacterium]|nr:MAG: DNA gyrase inhibitor YacG [Holosporaceae bacterium]